MDNQPLVSIIIPTYNRSEFIGETLDSVIAQTYQNWECIVVDDGSTDKTEEILQSYINKDNRISYHQRPATYKPGGNGARNYGFLKSTGKYIKWLDSDDLLTPNLLQDEYLIFSTDESCNFVFSAWQEFDKYTISIVKNKNILNKPKNGFELIYSIGQHLEYVLPGSYTVKREIVYLSGLWNISLRINQDGEFLFRLLINCNKVKGINKVGFLYRSDSTNKITKNDNPEIAYKRIKSWKIIEQQVDLLKRFETDKYLKTNKIYLFNYHKRRKEYDVIVNNYNFFESQILNERSRKIKLKLFIKIFIIQFNNLFRLIKILLKSLIISK